MTQLPDNTKIEATFVQNTITSGVGIDLGSCMSSLGYPTYNGLSFSFSPGTINSPNPSGERLQVLGSSTIKVYDGGTYKGCLTIEPIYDQRGPNNIAQFSLQVIVRNESGTSVKDGQYRPKELHVFDLNKGPVNVDINCHNKILISGNVPSIP